MTLDTDRWEVERKPDLLICCMHVGAPSCAHQHNTAHHDLFLLSVLGSRWINSHIWFCFPPLNIIMLNVASSKSPRDWAPPYLKGICIQDRSHTPSPLIACILINTVIDPANMPLEIGCMIIQGQEEAKILIIKSQLNDMQALSSSHVNERKM